MKSSTKKCLLQTWEMQNLTALSLSLSYSVRERVCFDVQTSSTKTFHFNHFYYYYTHSRSLRLASHTHTHKHLNGWHFSSMIASLSLKQKLTVGTREEKPSSYCLFFPSLLLLLLLVLVENAQKLFHIDIFASL